MFLQFYQRIILKKSVVGDMKGIFIYNFSDWNTVVENQWDLSIEEKRESEFMAIISNNELVAYGSISLKGDIAYIGIGLKPSFCGKGYGEM
ncbi:hypothetical protein EDD65_10187 [Keratinibaculum paraultunense]|uniref:Acetyltransferase (GNAT) family protein n=2 Tax=Keratinibaculum paraultunense TaxID=1278232 RepID=A0A4R3KZ55_9FIRM|nr:hypothetical protein EDD65_10187 [Keratinibaculum paraultunense]